MAVNGNIMTICEHATFKAFTEDDKALFRHVYTTARTKADIQAVFPNLCWKKLMQFANRQGVTLSNAAKRHSRKIAKPPQPKISMSSGMAWHLKLTHKLCHRCKRCRGWIFRKEYEASGGLCEECLVQRRKKIP